MEERNGKRLYSINEVMERLSFPRADVYKHIMGKQLQIIKVDRRVCVTEESLNDFENREHIRQTELGESVRHLLFFFSERLQSFGETELTDLDEKSDDEKLGELIRLMLLDGILHGATELHLDPVASGDRILYRQDGLLKETGRVDAVLSTSLKDKINSMPVLKETGEIGPKSGIIFFKDKEVSYQIRLAVVPTAMGDHLHLHFYSLDPAPDLGDLGYSKSQSHRMRNISKLKPGVLILAGPESPSAEVHRFAVLSSLLQKDYLVVSFEHRLHYQSELLLQVRLEKEEPITETIEQGLAMRPDVVVFDDVKTDVEAKSLLRFAYAGSFVIAQIRSSGVLEAISKFILFGINRNSFSRLLLGAVEYGQFRRLCSECRVKRPLTAREATQYGFQVTDEVWEGRGCDSCSDGFSGRRTVFGLWESDNTMLDIIRTEEMVEAALDEWNKQNAMSLSNCLRDAVLSRDLAFDDIKTFL